MGKVNKARGNMYDWVTHTWSPGIGCFHQCKYCFVRKFQALPIEFELDLPFPSLGTGRTIFVGHMCDIFSHSVSDDQIEAILSHCRKFNGSSKFHRNKFVFQTKNPRRACGFELPKFSTLGTTIETNNQELLNTISKAPPVIERAEAIHDFGKYGEGQTFITIEPILSFDPDTFADLIEFSYPSFVNIGADSKGHGLPEPSPEKINRLIGILESRGIEVRKKSNLQRLLKG